MARVDASTVRRLAVGDAVAVLAFVVVGEYQHSPFLFDPARLGDLAVQVAWASVPFLLGWAVAGGLLGAYRSDVLDSPARLATFTVGPWLVADVLGMALRSTAVVPGDASLVFLAVTAVFGSVFLLAWRAVPYALAES